MSTGSRESPETTRGVRLWARELRSGKVYSALSENDCAVQFGSFPIGIWFAKTEQGLIECGVSTSVPMEAETPGATSAHYALAGTNLHVVSEKTMKRQTSPSLYLVLSRGQWDADKSPEEIQEAIDAFYVWKDRLEDQGKLKAGQRLARQAKMVSRHAVVDGPFAETKEVIGGYWFFLASSLAEAAELAAQNPCLACGLTYEVRPIESERASAYKESNETPGKLASRLTNA